MEPHGKRGLKGLPGWWIDAEEAKERSKQNRDHDGDVWWELLSLDGKKVKVKQYDRGGPVDKPFWLYHNGDMYLGEWTTPQSEDYHPLEQGLGITYNRHKMKGLVCVSKWRRGLLHGNGKSMWLRESKIWKKNYLQLSPIWNKEDYNDAGRCRKKKKFSSIHLSLKESTEIRQRVVRGKSL